MDDGPAGQYLHPIAGLDAALWVPPSRGQLFWLRRAPALFAPALGTGRGAARWWAIATVTPSTNVTGLNLPYQSYLNHVFHRTRLARAGHAVCMPVIVTALLALLYPVHGTLPGAVALAAWWAYWAARARDVVWGAAPSASPPRCARSRWRSGGSARPGRRSLAQPWAWLLLGGALQAGSHILEPLPPRVSRSVHWMPPAQTCSARPGTATRRVPWRAVPASSPRRPPSAPLTRSSRRRGCCRCCCLNCSGCSGMTRSGAPPGGRCPPGRSPAATRRLTTSAPAARPRCGARPDRMDAGTIARIETFPLRIPFRAGGAAASRPPVDSLLVRVTRRRTYGWGEAFGFEATPVARRAVEDLHRSLCLGQDAEPVSGR